MTSKARILIVDDNEINISIVEEIICDDYDYTSAASGQAALDIAKTFRPDLILLDIMMPGIDGYETCRRIRQDEQLRFVKVVLVSAKAMASERLMGYEAGADDYITKPFVPEELLAKIKVYARLKFVEELDELRSRVLYLLNHEMRTPLTCVLSSLEHLMAGEASPDEAVQLARAAKEGCERLLQLFERSKLLCQIRSGQLEITKTEIETSSLLVEVVDSLTPFARSRNVTVQLRSQRDTTIFGDRAHLVTILYSLVHNAIRFSPSPGEIVLLTGADDTHTTLVVTDTGQGIDPDYARYVFEELLPSTVEHNTGGQGLSLALGNELARLHDGKLAVDTEYAGGTRFVLTLPSRADTPAQNAHELELTE